MKYHSGSESTLKIVLIPSGKDIHSVVVVVVGTVVVPERGLELPHCVPLHLRSWLHQLCDPRMKCKVS